MSVTTGAAGDGRVAGDRDGHAGSSVVAEHLAGGTPSTASRPPSRRSEAAASAGRPSFLIMDVCGAHMRPLGGWFPVAGLVVLMRQLQVDEQSTRSAVSRITKRGLLVAENRDGVRGYRLAGTTPALLAEAERRIFGREERARLADGWVLVSFSVPEEERDKRHLLRSRLAWLGFGLLASGLWIAPARMRAELEANMEALGFAKYLTVFSGSYHGAEDEGTLVERCWDLDALREMYAEFLASCGPVSRYWQGREPAGERAFVDYTLVLNQWRKFPYLDPGLPLELLPPAWEGQRAADLFFEVRERLAAPALRHVAEVTGLPVPEEALAASAPGAPRVVAVGA